MAKIKQKRRNNKGKINKNATNLKGSTNNKKAKLTFSSCCEKHCLLSGWVKEELKTLISKFKRIEKLTWKEIRTDSSLNYKQVTKINIKPPDTFPPESSLCSLEITKQARIFGYRTDEFFNIIWFDKNHIVCPQGKSKRYSV